MPSSPVPSLNSRRPRSPPEPSDAGQQHGAGAVAEQDARVSIGPVEVAAQEVHAHDQDLTVHAAGHEAGPGRQAEHEPRAGGVEVEAGRAGRAQVAGDEDAGCRHQVIRARGGHDEQGRPRPDPRPPLPARRGMRGWRGWSSSRRRRRSAVRGSRFRLAIHSSEVSTIFDRSSLVMIRDGAYIPHPGDHGPGRGHVRRTSYNGCWRFTRVPLSARKRLTVPATSDLISLNSFMASMRPTTWPASHFPLSST